MKHFYKNFNFSGFDLAKIPYSCHIFVACYAEAFLIAYEHKEFVEKNVRWLNQELKVLGVEAWHCVREYLGWKQALAVKHSKFEENCKALCCMTGDKKRVGFRDRPRCVWNRNLTNEMKCVNEDFKSLVNWKDFYATLHFLFSSYGEHSLVGHTAK